MALLLDTLVTILSESESLGVQPKKGRNSVELTVTGEAALAMLRAEANGALRQPGVSSFGSTITIELDKNAGVLANAFGQVSTFILNPRKTDDLIAALQLYAEEKVSQL